MLVSGVQQCDSSVCVCIYIYIYTHPYVYVYMLSSCYPCCISQVSWSLVQVGKEFPNVRQNKRRMEYIRVGDTVRTAGWLKIGWTPFISQFL